MQQSDATDAELVQIADDLRSRFSADELARLAGLLIDEAKSKGLAKGADA